MALTACTTSISSYHNNMVARPVIRDRQVQMSMKSRAFTCHFQGGVSCFQVVNVQRQQPWNGHAKISGPPSVGLMCLHPLEVSTTHQASASLLKSHPPRSDIALHFPKCLASRT
eukprot:5722334-Amphidinium_carterae.1